MIVTRTPLRISFCGGGSDLPSYYERYGGHAVSTTIDKYVYLTLERSFHADVTSLKYSTVEKVQDLDEIEHPIFRECLKMHDVHGVEINSTADIPSGTGMGSSSSFTVGLVNLLRAYQGKASDKELLAKKACEMEMEVLKEPIGKQDQYAAAYGGLNYYRFQKDGSVEVEHLALSKYVTDTLGRRLVLFYIGGQRNSSDILKKQNRSSKKRDADQSKICSLAVRLKDDLLSGNADSLGKILDESWKLKRGLTSGISNDEIDDIYALGMDNGAVGGKLLGAGGAGFMLFYAHEEDQAGLKTALRGCREIPFKMENEGSKIVFNDQS
ncbi:MAG: hypothetical protein FWG96_03375 [Methanomassiliicoccaceae archaeon]|nr:hypothetical protein [Methanomassiliicoccaceae archaeon]